MANGLAQYFDISEQDRMNIAFRSTTADKTMIFSGPPTFEMLGDTIDAGEISGEGESATGHIITPLAFSTNFTVQTSRGGSGEFPVIGSQDKFTQPSSSGSISIQLGAYSLVSGDPNATTAATTDTSKYTLLKRLYNDIIHYKSGELVKKYFISEDGGDTASGFKPIAATLDDLFINFAHSEFYEIEFGILRVTLTKGNEGVLVTYYENCKLVGGLSDSVQAGAQARFQPGVQMRAAKEIPLSWAAVKEITDGDTELNDFIADFNAYLNGE